MINRILIPCDFSQYSSKALKFAGEFAEQVSAGLVLVNVLNQREVETIKSALSLSDMIKQTIYLDDFVSKTKKNRLQQIQKIIEKESCSHLVIKKLVWIGIPYNELIRTVEEEKIDLVIMSTKGQNKLPGVRSGSTAEKMFHHCPVPLLSIRAEN